MVGLVAIVVIVGGWALVLDHLLKSWKAPVANFLVDLLGWVIAVGLIMSIFGLIVGLPFFLMKKLGQWENEYQKQKKKDKERDKARKKQKKDDEKKDREREKKREKETLKEIERQRKKLDRMERELGAKSTGDRDDDDDDDDS